MKTARRVAVVVGLVLITGAVAQADDVTDQITAGLHAYEQGHVNQTMQSLNYAIALLNQQMQQNLTTTVFPEPLEGWHAEEAGGMAMGGMLGGGTASSREYSNGQSRVSISLLLDSPAVAGIAMMLNNPMMAMSEPGTTIVTIQGLRAMQQFEDGYGELSMILDNRALITVEGSDIASVDILLAYANAINVDNIRQAIAH